MINTSKKEFIMSIQSAQAHPASSLAFQGKLGDATKKVAKAVILPSHSRIASGFHVPESGHRFSLKGAAKAGVFLFDALVDIPRTAVNTMAEIAGRITTKKSFYNKFIAPHIDTKKTSEALSKLEL